MKKRICIITSVFPRYKNDSEVPWLLKIVTGLKKAGYSILVFAPSFNGIKQKEYNGIEIYRFRYFFKKWETLTHDEGAPNKIHKFSYKIITIFYILFGLINIVRLVSKKKFDIINVHWPFPHAIFGIIAKYICKAKLVYNFYAAELLLMRDYKFVKIALKKFLEFADDAIAISSFTKNIIKSELNYKKSVHIVALGAAVEKKELKRYPKIKSKIPTLLFVGRLVERKGVPYLIKAIKLVLKEKKVLLKVIGDGDRRKELENLVNELNLQNNIIFMGKFTSEQLVPEYINCDIFILPAIIDSRGDTEGLGVVLLESLLYKKPVIASAVGGIVDVIKDGKTGILVPQKDPEALRDKILFLLSNKQFSAKLGTQGYKFILNNFSWKNIIKQLDAIFN